MLKFDFSNFFKSDLVKRLRKVVEALSDDGVEVDSPEYPGLARLASDLVKERYLKNKDKDVRLYTVLATMEIFRIVSIHLCTEILILIIE